MKLLITGAGRSGTTWFTRMFQQAGIPATHERVYNRDNRHVDAEWVCEASWLAAPYTPIPGVHVVRLVRHPLRVIASRATWGTFGPPGYKVKPAAARIRREKGDFAVRHCPIIATGDTLVDKAALHWAYWNRLVAADETIRIEDVTVDTVNRLAHIVDRSASVVSLGKPVNKGRPTTLTWDDIEHVEPVAELATELGYR